MSFLILVLVGLSTGKQLLDEVAAGDRLIWSKKMNGSWNCEAQIKGAILCRPKFSDCVLKKQACQLSLFHRESQGFLVQFL